MQFKQTLLGRRHRRPETDADKRQDVHSLEQLMLTTDEGELNGKILRTITIK